MTLILPRHRFPTSSEARTSDEVPMVARPNPDKNLSNEYIQMLGEKVVKNEERAIKRVEKKSMFLRPSDEESASVDKKSPPTKQPMKNMEAGRPVMIELSHCMAHSDMMEACAGPSQAHEPMGNLHTSLNDVVE